MCDPVVLIPVGGSVPVRVPQCEEYPSHVDRADSHATHAALVDTCQMNDFVHSIRHCHVVEFQACVQCPGVQQCLE